ncbi:hypothetical protein [Streptomyces sp. NPDC006997]|uniref:hypothetical protein n=1 Tax=Streptomyces sp. NPDC006997 TaxID=3155356 RepID=UPI0033DEE22B
MPNLRVADASVLAANAHLPVLAVAEPLAEAARTQGPEDDGDRASGRPRRAPAVRLHGWPRKLGRPSLDGRDLTREEEARLRLEEARRRGWRKMLAGGVSGGSGSARA